MKNSKVSVKKWTENEKLDWGETKVEFFVKDSSVLFGNLRVPPKTSTPLDGGHPKGEYVFIREGEATLVLLKENNEISRTNLKAGEAVLIPANVDHQTINSSNKEVSIIFFINL